MSSSSVASGHPALYEQRRLALRLIGDTLDATFEFSPGDERVRVVGRNAKADVVLIAPGVLPVHAYFERDGDEIWVAPMERRVPVYLNETAVVIRAPLPESAEITLGETRLTVTVLSVADDAPRMDSLVTGARERIPQRYALEEFRTTSIDGSLFDEQPTAAWQRPSTPRPPPGNAMEEMVQQTVVIPRTMLAAPRIEEVEAMAPITQRLPVIRSSVPRIEDVTPPPLSAASHQMVTEAMPRPFAPMPLAPSHWPRSTETASVAPDLPVSARPNTDASTQIRSERPEPTAPMGVPRVEQVVSDLITTSEPIAEIFNASGASSRSTRTSHSRPTRLTDLRGAISALERKPLVVVAIVLLAMAAFAALARQAVLTWRQARPAIVTSAPNKRVALGGATAGAAPACSSPGVDDDSAIAAQEGADPLVHEATLHLVRGRRAEAARAYSELSNRYPGDCGFFIASKVLKQKGTRP